MNRSENREYQIRVVRDDGKIFLDKFKSKKDAQEMIIGINKRSKHTGCHARMVGPV
jgi:hypothetical protein